MAVQTKVLPVPTDTPYRLGRHVEHDDRSRDYEFRAVRRGPTKDKLWSFSKPVLNQMNTSCHDDQTEILTRQGWLPFPDLTLDNEVATVDPVTAEVSYQRPVRVIAQPYCGPLHVAHNRSHDFAVTPNHRMLVRKWDESCRALSPDYTLVPMADVGWYAGFLTNVRQRGGQETYALPGLPGYKRASQRADLVVPMGSWLRFLGIYLAEGTMCPQRKNPNRIQIAAVKDRERTFVRRVLAELGVLATEYADRFVFSNARIFHHLEQLGLKGVYAAEKFVPRFVFEQSSESIEEFLRGHREGDGCFSQRHQTWAHCTTSSQLADDLQELMFLAGYKVGRSVQKASGGVIRGRQVGSVRPLHVVRALKGAVAIQPRQDVQVVPYDGMVYCAEVPIHHTLVTRRNGKVLVSGNSCVGNTITQFFNTDYAQRCRTLHQVNWYTEGYALNLYHLATVADGVTQDIYPPNDNGTSALGGAKAAQELGLVDTYQHAFDFGAFQAAIETQPVCVGTLWTNQMFSPDPTGLISVGNLGDPNDPNNPYIAGGHEYLAVGISYTLRQVRFLTSWGPDFGLHGEFMMTFADFETLLSNDGDVLVLHGIGMP